MRNRRILCGFLASVIVGVGAPRLAQAAPSNVVAITPASAQVALNQTVVLTIAGSSFSQVVDGGGVSLSFNPARLQVVSVVVDAPTWEFFASAGTIDNTLGRVSDIAFASFAGPTGSFPIAKVTFRGIANGSSPVTVSSSAANPFGSGGQPLSVSFTPSNVTVGTVVAAPAPVGPWGTWGVCAGLCLVGLVTLRRRQLTQLSYSIQAVRSGVQS